MPFFQKQNSLESKRFDPAKYSNTCIGLHFHKNPEIILCTRGFCRLNLMERNEIIPEGSCALIIPYEVHGVELDKNSEIYVIVFSGSYTPEFIEYIKGKATTHSVFNLSAESAKSFLALFDPIQPQFTEVLRSLTFYKICTEFLSSALLVESKSNESSLNHKILNYISDNCLSDISLKTMADSLGYDKNYLSRVLHKTLKIGFNETLNHCRCEHAVNLMRGTNLSITQIALECGFGSVRSFDRAFLQQYKMSPREYKNKFLYRS